MILDAVVPVLCDGKDCHEVAEVEVPYVYHSYSGESGQYDTRDSVIESNLVDDHEWIVEDGQHFCSEYCQGKEEDDDSDGDSDNNT